MRFLVHVLAGADVTNKNIGTVGWKCENQRDSDKAGILEFCFGEVYIM